jgi:hypothetical protein
MKISRHQHRPVPIKQQEEGDGYKIGYKNPPKHTQFKKGISGNPEGRPKGDKNINTLFSEAFNKEVTVNEKGGSKKIKIKELMFQQLAIKAGKGDMKVILFAWNILSRKEEKDNLKKQMLSELKTDDKEIWSLLMSQYKGENNE